MTTAFLLPVRHSPVKRASTDLWCTALCCIVLAGGCARPQPSPDAAPKAAANLPTPQATASTPAPTKPLDLSRDALQSMDQVTQEFDEALPAQKNLLPNLFDNEAKQTGTKTSGRVLMNKDAQDVVQGIEGVEFKVEVPVN